MNPLTRITHHLFSRKIHVYRWQWNLFGTIMFSLGIVFSLYLLTDKIILPNLFAASSPWVQTDWSGGQGSSPLTQYESASNVDTGIAGEIRIQKGAEQLNNSGFDSNFNGWDTGIMPSKIGGLKSWHAADTIQGVSDGTALTSWNDSGANNTTLSQSDAQRKPVYKANILNGKAVVRFDGQDDYLSNNTAITGFTSAASIVSMQVIRGNQCAGAYELGVNYGVNSGFSLIPWCGTHYSCQVPIF